MKLKNIISAFSAILFSVVSCIPGKQEHLSYGSPVFGTVPDGSPIVETKAGKVLGEANEGVAIFRGIPYGGPCDGQNRWKAPTPVQPWEGVLDCTKIGPAAIQAGSSIVALDDVNGKVSAFGQYGKDRFSENCLVLNVVTPGLDKKRRPVLFYTHGGGFSSGSGILTLGSAPLAREQDIVVVGINHRLNVFGYLYLGALDDAYASSGNVGMLDVVQALQWVQDNIASFGGDPSNVTIMGESGGGMKVTNLMAMPAAKGLFHKAIVESGSSPVGGLSAEQAAAETEKYLKRLGLTAENWRQIYSMTPESLYQASLGITFAPVGDNIILPYAEGGTFAPELSKEIPLLVGSSADELGSFIPIDTTLTWDTLADRLLSLHLPLSKANAALDKEHAVALVNRFRAQDRNRDEPWHMLFRIVSLSGSLGDAAFSQAMAKALQGGAPVYSYFIERDTPITGHTDYRCAWHTADLPLQFRVLMYPEQENWSKVMTHAWAAFARTGSPSTASLPWPAFTPDARDVMVFDNNDINEVRKDPLKRYRDEKN